MSRFLDVPMLSSIEAFLLSDRVTLKGSEAMAFNTMLSAIQQEKAAQQNAQQVALRARPVAVPDKAASDET